MNFVLIRSWNRIIKKPLFYSLKTKKTTCKTKTAFENGFKSGDFWNASVVLKAFRFWLKGRFLNTVSVFLKASLTVASRSIFERFSVNDRRNISKSTRCKRHLVYRGESVGEISLLRFGWNGNRYFWSCSSVPLNRTFRFENHWTKPTYQLMQPTTDNYLVPSQWYYLANWHG